MEVLTILLSALLGIVSPVGFVVDSVAETAIRDQLASVEELAVRIDNTPSHDLLRGRVDRVRIAGRGLYPVDAFRIAVLEVETDAIALDPSRLRQGEPELEQPLQAAVKVVLTEEDLNQLLQSDPVADRLADINLDFMGRSSAQDYDLVNPNVEFLGENRFRFQIAVQGQQSGEQKLLVAESGIVVLSGRRVQLVEPIVTIDGEPLPPQFLEFLIGGLSRRLDLGSLENSGITARVLKLEMEGDQLTLVSFVRVEPDADLAF